MPETIMLCCNNPRNGNPTPYADAIELFDCKLVGGRVRVDWSDKKLRDATSIQGDHTLRVGKLRVPCLLYNTWVGNWCWDAAKIRLIFAVQIWNELVCKPDWHCEEGPSRLFELFNSHLTIDPRTAPEMISEALGISGVR